MARFEYDAFKPDAMDDQEMDMMAVLRVSGNEDSVAAFLASNERLSPDSTWKAGERDWKGRTRERSGFNLLLADGNEWEPLVGSALRRLAELAAGLLALRESGATVEVDFAIDAGARGSAYGSAWFSPEALGTISSLGLELRITAYPVSGGPE